jgi:hypothetical protein
MLFRDQDDGMKYEANVREVLPATFLHNSIETPNPAYNIGDCGGQLVPSVGTLVTDPSKNTGDPFWSTNNKKDKDNIDGVFYAHDSNSSDQRAYYAGNKVWIGDGFKDDNGTKTLDKTCHGAGSLKAGSPLRGFPGGGTGYHVPVNRDKILAWDQPKLQADAYQNVPDWAWKGSHQQWYNNNPYSFINYAGYGINYLSLNSIYDPDGWKRYIQDWSTAFQDVKDKEPWKWAYMNDWNAVGDLLGWVDNIRAMISLQNALWINRSDWNQCEKENYWGWNEIPMDAQQITHPSNFGGYAVILPINNGGERYNYDSLASVQKTYIKAKLKAHWGSGFRYDYVAILAQLKSPYGDPKMYLDCTEVFKYSDLTA